MNKFTAWLFLILLTLLGLLTISFGLAALLSITVKVAFSSLTIILIGYLLLRIVIGIINKAAE